MKSPKLQPGVALVKASNGGTRAFQRVYLKVGYQFPLAIPAEQLLSHSVGRERYLQNHTERRGRTQNQRRSAGVTAALMPGWRYQHPGGAPRRQCVSPPAPWAG